MIEAERLKLAIIELLKDSPHLSIDTLDLVYKLLLSES